MTTVLVVDDEPQLLRALRVNLAARRYAVVTAASGAGALAAAAREKPDAVILDLGLPDLDGVEVIGGLRGWTAVPIIVLSGRTGSADKVGALDAGADDYVTKPFAIEELLARLPAALRRREPDQPAIDVVLGHCHIDLGAHTITRYPGVADGVLTGGPIELVHLTPTEWAILELLLRYPARLVTSRQMLTDIWGPGHERESNYLRFHMAKLRRKLEPDLTAPRHLITELGMGYRYQP